MKEQKCFIILDCVSTFSIWCCHITVSEKLIMLTWSFSGRNYANLFQSRGNRHCLLCGKQSLKGLTVRAADSHCHYHCQCLTCPVSSVPGDHWKVESYCQRIEGGHDDFKGNLLWQKMTVVNLINWPLSFNFGKVTFVKKVHIWSTDLGENAFLVTSPLVDICPKKGLTFLVMAIFSVT